MSFHVYLLPIDAELAAELEASLVDRSRLRRLQSPAELVECAASSTLVRAIVAIDDAARLDAAWWREIRKQAANAELLVVARHCDEETWRRWTLLGGVGVRRPPFGAIDLEVEFAGEPALSALFRRHPQLGQHGKTMFRYTIPSDPQYIPGIAHVVALLAFEFGFAPADYTTNIPLALDEAVSNAIRHGNRRDQKKHVEIEGQIDSEMLRLKIRDQGEGFDRDPAHDPVDPANLLASSGRGLFLIESVMDEVRYLQEGRCIELIKRSRATSAAPTAKAGRGDR